MEPKPNSLLSCNPSWASHLHPLAQVTFAAPLHLCQTGLRLANFRRTSHPTDHSIPFKLRRRLHQLHVGFSCKRLPSKLKQCLQQMQPSPSASREIPPWPPSSALNESNLESTFTQAPQILKLSDKWVAVNKPSGILVHRTKLYKAKSHETYLKDYVSHLVQQETGVTHRVLPVQRLDRPTSGVMVFALDCSENAAELQSALKSLDCIKQYWALAFGACMPKRWVNNHPLKDIDGKERKQRAARTEFEVIQVFDTADIVVVNARLTTGRRHQVRRHLSNSRHPVLGDSSYCKGKLNRMVREIYGVKRCCLHSQSLYFKDPSTGHQISIHAPLPGDLQNVLDNIKNLEANTS